MEYTDANNWSFYKKGLMPISPPHLQRALTRQEKKLLFRIFPGAWYIRSVTDFDRASDHRFWYVIKDGRVSMAELSSNTRNQVRRCLNNCRVERIPVSVILDSGYEIYCQELERYARKGFAYGEFPREKFESVIRGHAEHGQEFWGVFYEERLIAYSVVKRKADMVDYYTWKADYVHYKRLNPIYGLLYRMNEYYLNELGLRYVNDGNRSYTEHSQVQSFLLEKFKFRKAYATSRVYFRWWFKPVVVGLYLFRGWIRNNALRSFARMYEWSK